MTRKPHPSKITTMRQLRNPNSTTEYVAKCDHCDEPVEAGLTTSALVRYVHVHGSRWCNGMVEDGEARTVATHKGRSRPYGHSNNEDFAAIMDDLDDLAAVIDELEDKRVRLRNNEANPSY